MAKKDWSAAYRIMAQNRLAGRPENFGLEDALSGADAGKKTPDRKVAGPETKKPGSEKAAGDTKERQERIQRERREAVAAVDSGLALIRETLSRPGLDETQRQRLLWLQNDIMQAKGQLDFVSGKDFFTDAVTAGSETRQRQEGLPVDGLMNFISNLKQRVQISIDQIQGTLAAKKESRKTQDEFETADAKTVIDTGEHQEQDLGWYSVWQNLPDTDRLKARALAWLEHMEAEESAKAHAEGRAFVPYEGEAKQKKLGEALRETVKEYLQIDEEDLKKTLQQRQEALRHCGGLLKALEKSSLPYLAFHFPEHPDGQGLSKEEEAGQKLFTGREAEKISGDEIYKKMLMEELSKAKLLPANFADFPQARQNWTLAELALQHRRVLVLPQERQQPQTVESKPQSKKVTLENTNQPYGVEYFDPDLIRQSLKNDAQPYDAENFAMSVPEAAKVPDKKLFLIDISEIAKRMAWTKAEEKLRQQFDHKGGFWGKVVKNAWKGLSENHYRIKFYKEALAEIQNDNNLMRAISERVSGQTLPGGGARVSGEYLELLDKIVAEYKHDVVDTSREVGGSMNSDPEVQRRFAELLYRYRTNKWDGAAYRGLDKRAAVELFVKENIAGYINRQTSAAWTTDSERIKEAKGLLYASNFYEILESVDQNYKQQIDAAVQEVMAQNPEADIEAVTAAIASHVEGVQGLNLQLGLKERDLVNNRPKGILRLYERMVDWGEKHKVLGKIVMNPFVVGAAATLTSQGAQRAIKWAAVGGAVAAGASGFWVPLGAGAVAGGLYRAFKRGKDVQYDLAQEQRHRTLGGKPSEILAKGRDYGILSMQFSEAQSAVAALAGKKTFSESERQQLAKIYARLQLERDLLKEQGKDFVKMDLFDLGEDVGKRFGSTEAARADLRIALKGLGITEQTLQGAIDAEKGEILKKANEIRKIQESFRRKEMRWSFAGGAFMGFAGGVLAQEVMHLGGEQLEKLWGGQYFHNQQTSFDKIVDWAKGSSFYQSHFGQGAMAGAGIEHIVTSRSQTSGEWLQQIKDHIAGGNVEKIHTQNWYDNPTGETPHIHNANELQFHISKDSAGGFHFKVPIEENGSWNEKGWTDIEKAFSEGRIKMLFVPDGGSPHDAIVLDVNPATHEVIVPKGSNIANLFDEVTGRPKGNGFFGLAEQTGIRQDGSQDYVWINSERGTGGQIDFGKATQTIEFTPDKPVPAEIVYDQTIATVPPQRKVFARPGENPKAEKKKQKAAEKKAKKQAKENTTATVAAGNGSRESGGGGGGGSLETSATTVVATTETTNQQPAQTETGAKKTEVAPAASVEQKPESGGETAAEPKKKEEEKVDPELEEQLDKFNRHRLNEEPHYKLQFDTGLKIPPKSKDTKRFVTELIAAIDDKRRGLRDGSFADKNVVLKFSTNGPYEPSVDKYGTLVLNLDPDLELNALIPIMRRQLKNRERSARPENSMDAAKPAAASGEKSPAKETGKTS